MPLRQFLNTLSQILHSESVHPVPGIMRHLGWQCRRTLNLFPAEFELGRSRLFVDRPGGVAALVNALGEYDYNNMGLLRLVLAHTVGTFIDVGANIGAYTLVASEEIRAVVVSIEPHPVAFRLLEENVRRNGRPNVTCLNVAVSDHEGRLRLTDQAEFAINRILAPEEAEPRAVEVDSRTIEAICQSLGVSPDFVKIDVEGHEHAVLAGFGQYRSHSRMIIVEDGENPSVRRWMDEAGFLGPYFCRLRKRVFSRVKQRRPEDPVYLKPEFVDYLPGLGFSIEV